VVPVKPIGRFVERWHDVADRILAESGRMRMALVGAGAGGTELTLSIQHRLGRILADKGVAADRLEFHLFTDMAEVMTTHNARVRGKFARILAERGVRVHTDTRVVRVDGGHIECERGETFEVDEVLWVTQAGAQSWPGESGLDVDEHGFIRVDDSLRSLSHPEVFAAGDIANVAGHPRPKAGVFAVRQGPPLHRNLRRVLVGKQPKPFSPQKRFLSLVSTGDAYAVASRGPLAFEGRWVWAVKDWIDRRWMRKYIELPEMADDDEVEIARGLAGPEAMKEISAIAMRCGGCGAKVGSTVLGRVMNDLEPVERDDVLVGLKAPDDAAVVDVPLGKVMVHTVDYFRSFIDDPYVFGQIAANHALGDIFAMGAEPQSALAVVTIPYGLESKVEGDLREIMAGAMKVLADNDTALVGGHTSEGAKLALGFSVNGLADRSSLLRKEGMTPGDAIVITKPIGTGTLFAADMRQKAKGRWIDAALSSMIQSNRAGAECLFRHGATSCTDVTGFGVLGHLVEMIRPSGVDVDVWLDAVPLLDGALECVRDGVFSSLQPQNVRLRRAIRNQDAASANERYPLVFDPQTAGGLLATVPGEAVERCVAELRALGYAGTAIIGEVRPESDALEPIRLLDGAPERAEALAAE
jgi:selenide,water dikinase